ncbi:MAG: SDR family oxidoreductase [Verrucomicrobia bacterium]|nr:SDR family oxidoreductase [Verrucomicrobiota bacterium]
MAKKIVLSGCTRGLGKALAREFASLGHTVLGCGRNAQALSALQRELGAPHHFQTVDITDAKQLECWAGTVLKRYGPPDILINNAAVIHPNANLWELDNAEFAKVFQVNVIALHAVIKAYLPNMIQAGKGIIVNLSSGAGRTAFPEIGGYCASKFAVEGMTKSLALELPPGMACIALSPGVVDTDMLRSNWGDLAATCQTPDEWARRATPFILNLRCVDNGQSLTTPQPYPCQQ